MYKNLIITLILIGLVFVVIAPLLFGGIFVGVFTGMSPLLFAGTISLFILCVVVIILAILRINR